MKSSHFGIIGGFVGVFSILVILLIFSPTVYNEVSTTIKNSEPIKQTTCQILGKDLELIKNEIIIIQNKMPVAHAGMSEQELQQLMLETSEYAEKIESLRNKANPLVTDYVNNDCDLELLFKDATDGYGRPLDEETKQLLKSIYYP